MRYIILFFFIGLSIIVKGQKNQADTALLIIDIQNFYYPCGKSELVNPEASGKNTAKLLTYFRSNKMLVVHVRHNFEPGGEIQQNVKPLEKEKVVSKNKVNCFKNTDLLEYLKANNIKHLVICGMQTHMCVEAATRAGSEYGFECIVVQDACATKNLKYGDKEIKASDVHFSTLATLKSYAKIFDVQEFLK